jgi:hypothetical protein
LHVPSTAHCAPAEPPFVPQPLVAPQWVVSVLGSTHVPLQPTIGATHGATHDPFVQVEPVAQACPAEPVPSRPQPGVAPQFVAEALGSMQLEPHRINPPVQAQLPSKQICPPVQAVPALLPWHVPDAPQ